MFSEGSRPETMVRGEEQLIPLYQNNNNFIHERFVAMLLVLLLEEDHFVHLHQKD